MKTLIIGKGEVGTALYNILGEVHNTAAVDKVDNFSSPVSENPDIIHICFPYFDGFEKEVQAYQKRYSPSYTVIHSTVPVGTSRSLGAIHSPVRGKHPNLEKSLLTFEKYLAGQGIDELADYFRQAGIEPVLIRKQETAELAKILSTTRYGMMIEIAKETEQLCNEYDVPFSEVYTLWEQGYNEGYKKLDMSHVVRPILQPQQKKIGGHCVLENLELQNSKMAEFIKK